MLRNRCLDPVRTVTMDRMDLGLPLLLRPLALADEAEARRAHEELARDRFTFLLGHRPGEPWGAYVERMEAHRRGIDLPEDMVPATFLVADVGGALVGRTSIRHELNDFLAEFGGHVGYGVRPAFRRQGFASEILRQSLDVLREVGVGRALVTCDVDNVGSAAVIEACGGRFERVAPERDGTPAKRRYWIDLA